MAVGYSLHLGLNNIDTFEYKGNYPPLRNAENDADFYHTLANGKGFKSKLLKGKDATSLHLLNTLNNYASKAIKGDTVFISYSGHGTRVKDLNGDEDDKLDEALVLFDRLFIDDEFQICWSLFTEGVRIFFINDSCNNGSVTRIFVNYKEFFKSVWPEHILRGVDKEQAAMDFDKNSSLYKSITLRSANRQTQAACSIIHIGACQDNQLADDGNFTSSNGNFTTIVKKVCLESAFNGSYKFFFDIVSKEMPPWQTPSWDTKAGTKNEAFEKSAFLVI